jgi:hypothetical protein
MPPHIPVFVVHLLWHDDVPVVGQGPFPCELCCGLWAFWLGWVVWFLVDWARLVDRSSVRGATYTACDVHLEQRIQI